MALLVGICVWSCRIDDVHQAEFCESKSAVFVGTWFAVLVLVVPWLLFSAVETRLVQLCIVGLTPEERGAVHALVAWVVSGLVLGSSVRECQVGAILPPRETPIAVWDAGSY
eukprot:COSAG02_NODE_44348_length_367_cov_0.686567_1_plen_111_part_01